MQTLIYCTAFSHDEKELNDDAADSGSTYILCRWTIKTAVATATRWQRWSKHIKKKTVLMGFVAFFFFSQSSINLQSYLPILLLLLLLLLNHPKRKRKK